MKGITEERLMELLSQYDIPESIEDSFMQVGYLKNYLKLPTELKPYPMKKN